MIYVPSFQPRVVNFLPLRKARCEPMKAKCSMLLLIPLLYLRQGVRCPQRFQRFMFQSFLIHTVSHEAFQSSSSSRFQVRWFPHPCDSRLLTSSDIPKISWSKVSRSKCIPNVSLSADGHSSIPADVSVYPSKVPRSKCVPFCWWSFFNSSWCKCVFFQSFPFQMCPFLLMIILQFQLMWVCILPKFSVPNVSLSVDGLYSIPADMCPSKCSGRCFSTPVSWCASTLLATGVLTPIVLALWAWPLCGFLQGSLSLSLPYSTSIF